MNTSKWKDALHWICGCCGATNVCCNEGCTSCIHVGGRIPTTGRPEFSAPPTPMNDDQNKPKMAGKGVTVPTIPTMEERNGTVNWLHDWATNSEQIPNWVFHRAEKLMIQYIAALSAVESQLQASADENQKLRDEVEKMRTTKTDRIRDETIESEGR